MNSEYRIGGYTNNLENPISTYTADQKDHTTPHYEFSNHLGNVLATFTARRLGIGTGTTVTHYEPEIISLRDYEPFGREIPERLYNNTTFAGDYRYGFNDD